MEPFCRNIRPSISYGRQLSRFLEVAEYVVVILHFQAVLSIRSIYGISLNMLEVRWRKQRKGMKLDVTL